jgi:hypothetical protein
MSSRQVGKYVVDWVKIGTRVPQVARGEFSGFRSRHEAIKSRYIFLYIFVIFLYYILYYLAIK